MLLFSAFANINPGYAFVYVHYGWFYGMSIAVFLLSLILGVIQLFIYNRHSFVKRTNLGASQIILGICVLILFINCSTKAGEYVYMISSPEDFALLKNLPIEGEDVPTFYLGEDIDFEGETITEPFGREGARYILHGNGYHIKNLNADLVLTEKVNALFINSYYKYSVDYFNAIDYDALKNGTGALRNIVFENCSFTLTPNGYDTDSFSSYKCIFALAKENDSRVIVSSDITMINTTVTVKPAIENIRSIDKTSIGSIFAELVSSDLSGLNIVREEESE
jgi:hypothetical protein